MFLTIGQSNGPLQKKKTHQSMLPNLINMGLQEGMVFFLANPLSLVIYINI
jgi:hypothetical protein